MSDIRSSKSTPPTRSLSDADVVSARRPPRDALGSAALRRAIEREQRRSVLELPAAASDELDHAFDDLDHAFAAE